MKTIEYLDAVKALTPTGTTYAAAQVLGLPEETVRNWLKRKRPDAYACARIAEVLNLPIEQVLADIESERATDPEKKAYWESLSRKFAACLVMGSAITTFPIDGRSATGLAIDTPSSGNLRAANYAGFLRRLWDQLRLRGFALA